MLVHAKTFNGVVHLEGKRIYGIGTGYPPTDVPYAFYERYKDALSDATYREETLKRLFGRDFEEVAFKYSELYRYSSKYLDKIGRPIYRRHWRVRIDKGEKLKRIYRALRKASPKD